MIHLKKTVLYAFIVSIWTLIFGLLASCAEDQQDIGGFWGPRYCLYFTDNEEPDYGYPEKLTVSSSAQTIELKLKRVKGEDMPVPSKLYFNVAEWDESTQEYIEPYPFNSAIRFYKVYTKEEDGETVVCIELVRNDQDTERRLLV